MLGDQGQSLWLEAQGRWVPSTGRTQDSLCWGQAAWPRRPQQGQGGGVLGLRPSYLILGRNSGSKAQSRKPLVAGREAPASHRVHGFPGSGVLWDDTHQSRDTQAPFHHFRGCPALL